jgi:hypothetical protein
MDPESDSQRKFFLYIFFGGLECAGHSFAYVAHYVFLRGVWIRTQRTTVASRRAINLATHLPYLVTHLSNLATHLPLKLVKLLLVIQ